MFASLWLGQIKLAENALLILGGFFGAKAIEKAPSNA